MSAPAATEMPATFRARLDAALARPSLLDPGAVDAVAAAAFAPRADAGEDAAPMRRPHALEGDVAVVSISGPLAQRAWSCWMFAGDGYDAITDRVRAALADPAARAVLLVVDSPGGEVAGCFEALRAIRALATDAGKPLVGFADELACSAAYALACACDEIVCPDTGRVGSVGVITTVYDRTAANAAAGRNVRVIRSGARKAAPHPDAPLDDPACASVQADIDALAAIFAAEVAQARGLDPAAVLALQGASFLAGDARKHGLLDHVGNRALALQRARALADQRAAPPTTIPSGRLSASAAATLHTETDTMAYAILLAALGLKPEASEAEALAAYNAQTTTAKQFEALTGETGPEALAVARAWKASHERVGAIEAAETERRAQQARVERAAVLDAAVSDGKLTPHERAAYDTDADLAAIPLGALRKEMANRRQLVATEATTGRRGTPGAAPTTSALTAEERAICSQTGVTEAEYLARKTALAAEEGTE